MRISILSGFIVLALGGAAMAAASDGWHLGKNWGAALYRKGAGVTEGMSGSSAVYIAGKGNYYGSLRTTFLQQSIPLDAWRGRRLLVTLRLKDEDEIRGLVSFFLRKQNGDGLQAALQRDGNGETGWQTHQFVVDVPDDADALQVGLGAHGSGKLWVDDIRIEAAGADVTPSPTRRQINNGPTEGFNGPIAPPPVTAGPYHQ
jgi:hypothetical protein